MKKIYYIGYYGDKTRKQNRRSGPAADTKMDYIVESMKKIGYDVEIISFCEESDKNSVIRKYGAYDVKINGCNVHFFKTYTSKYRIVRVIGRYIVWLSQKKYILKNCVYKDSVIIVYHSLSFLKLIKFLNKKNKKYILEMEEIYADVINKPKIKPKEISLAMTADAYVFPTELLDKKINTGGKKSLIIYGTYKVENTIDNTNSFFNDGKIHCVYAGTFDPRKGCIDAIRTAKFLSQKYHVHIIGFGTDSEIKNLKSCIHETQKEAKATITYDGLLYGDEYIKFVQSCHIGLSTQMPDSSFCDTSFPSKILSYMSNGLRVVSVKLQAIEKSKIGELVYYYEEQTPQSIAKTIRNIKIDDDYDSKKVINKLSKNFINDLKNFLSDAN